ncbi:peptidoglycan binding domain-containing protein, partial [Candidatus Collierbacteria bacterium]|nr:peptidoglycan binding domain-containing protein [Candidatus Collierbacteria bacterium]
MKRFFKIWHELMHLTGWAVAGAALIGFVVAVAYELAYSGMVLPKTLVANIDVSNSSKEQTLRKLSARFLSDPTRVEVVYRDNKIDTVDLNFGVDLAWAVSQAWSVGRSGNILTRLSERIEVFFTPRQIDVPVKYDPDELEGLVASITTEVNQESVSPQVVFDKDSNLIKLIPGKDGLLVDEENLKQRIVLALGVPGLQKVEVPTKVDSQAIDTEKVNSVMATANSWLGKTLRLRYKEYFTDLDTGEILSLLSLQNETFNEKEIESL